MTAKAPTNIQREQEYPLVRDVLCSSLWFLTVGPLAGTCVFLVMAISAQPRLAPAIVPWIPWLIVLGYIVGAVPAALTGAVLGIVGLNDRLGRNAYISVPIGAVTLLLYAHSTMGRELIRVDVLWSANAFAGSGLLQIAIWGGLSAWLTRWVVGHISAPLGEAFDMYRRGPPAW